MEIGCKKCDHIWDYKGSSKFYATCPSCKSPIKITYGEVYKRAKGKCEKCSSKRILEFHHIKPRGFGIDDRKENLQLLCHDCHIEIKRITIDTKKKKFMNLNQVFTKEEYFKLLKAKGKKSWHKFIMGLANEKL